MKVVEVQGQKLKDDGESLHIHIKKPIYGTCVSLNSKIIKYAIDTGRLLKVSCFSKGSYYEEIISPSEWVWKSKRFEKVYKVKNKPMVFYQATINQKSEGQPTLL